MNENNQLPRSIPPMENPFDVLVSGSITGRKYVGGFESRILTGGDRARSKVLQAQFNQGQEKVLAEKDPEVLFFHEMIAYLRYAIAKAPDWWVKADGGRELHDSNVVLEVYTKAIEFEGKWSEQIWGPKEKETPTDGDGQPKTN